MKKTASIKRNYQPVNKAVIALCTVFLFSGTNLVSAQADTARKLKEVKVSSSNLPNVQTATPSQQIGSNDFKRYAAFNVADAIRDFSGVNIKDYGGIGGLKTVSIRSLGASNTGVLYDGILINDAQNGQVDIGRLNLDNISSITLYNGQPSDILQPARSYSAASILIIVPLKPTFETAKAYNVKAAFSTGTFGLVNPTLLYQQKLSQNWSAAVNGNYQQANGRYVYKNQTDGSDTLATRRNTDIKALQTEASLYWNKTDSNYFNIRFNYYNSNQGLPGAVIDYNPSSLQRLWDRVAYIQSKYRQSWANGLSLLLNGKLSTNYERYVDPSFLNNTGGADQDFTQREAYQSTAFAYRLTPDFRVSYASDLSLTDLQSNLYNYAYPVRFTWLNVIAGDWKLGKFNLLGNLLNTRISERVSAGDAAPAKSVFSPTLMVTAKPFSSNLQLRAFYKNTFHNPTFNDLYYTRVGNRLLKPEYNDQFDLGATYVKATAGKLEYITLTADAYYNDVKNKIVAVPGQDLGPSNWSIQNIGRVAIEGLDACLKSQYQLSNNWKAVLSANYTYQQALDVTDPSSPLYLGQIPYTPQNTFAVNAGVFNKKASLYYNHIYYSSRYYSADNLPQYLVPGFSVSDISATFQLKIAPNQAVIALEVNNLFNQSYAIIRSYPMPGRSFRFSFQINI